MKKLNVKSKKTKVSIDPNLTSITRTQFDMGTYAKKKSGNYTWAKPYFKLVCNDDAIGLGNVMLPAIIKSRFPTLSNTRKMVNQRRKQ